MRGKGSAREVEDAMREVIDHLGIVLVDMPGATCCGAGVMKQANHTLQLTLNARTFAMAEQMDLDVLTPCATCQGNMYEDLAMLLEDEALRASVNETLERTCGMRFEGNLRMRHLLQVLVEDVGLDVVERSVVNPIQIPIAGYYGVPMLQDGASGDDDPHDPIYFAQLIEVLGAPSIDYESSARSVGFGVDGSGTHQRCDRPQRCSMMRNPMAPRSWPPHVRCPTSISMCTKVVPRR